MFRVVTWVDLRHGEGGNKKIIACHRVSSNMLYVPKQGIHSHGADRSGLKTTGPELQTEKPYASVFRSAEWQMMEIVVLFDINTMRQFPRNILVSRLWLSDSDGYGRGISRNLKKHNNIVNIDENICFIENKLVCQ